MKYTSTKIIAIHKEGESHYTDDNSVSVWVGELNDSRFLVIEDSHGGQATIDFDQIDHVVAAAKKLIKESVA